MQGILRVTPEKLIQTATEFSNESNRIRVLTQQMLEIVQGSQSVWSSDTASQYQGKFAALQSDMDKMYRMIQKYTSDLNQMAKNYQDSEVYGEEKTASLETNVII